VNFQKPNFVESDEKSLRGTKLETEATLRNKQVLTKSCMRVYCN